MKLTTLINYQRLQWHYDKLEDRQGAVYKIKCSDCQAILTLVKPVETLAHDWPNTNKRWEMVTSTITLSSPIFRWNITLTGTLWLTCIMYSTGYYQRLTLESWFTNLEQTPQNNDLLTESGKTNYKQTTGQLTIWLTINDCLTVKTDGLKCTNDITSLHSQ